MAAYDPDVMSRACLHAPASGWPSFAGPGDDDDDDDETPIGDPDDDDEGDEDEEDDEEDTLWAQPVFVVPSRPVAGAGRVESPL